MRHQLPKCENGHEARPSAASSRGKSLLVAVDGRAGTVGPGQCYLRPICSSTATRSSETVSTVAAPEHLSTWEEMQALEGDASPTQRRCSDHFTFAGSDCALTAVNFARAKLRYAYV